MTSHTVSATEEEEQLAAQILVMTNCHQTGVLGSEAAIDIFKRSGLSFVVLRDIWNIADANGSGDLTKDELAVAIRLMGWVQMGESLDDGLLAKAGPLPTLEGITDIVRKKPSAVHFPPINPEDVRNFKRKFVTAGPIDGFLDGQKVMDSFMTSNLSYDDIWKIKKLIDQHNRGSLDFREFSLGMFLIQSLQSCLISSVPSTFPHDLFRQFPDLSQVVEVSRKSVYLSLTPRATPDPSSPGASTPLSLGSRSLSSEIEEQEALWEILPFERREADQQFAEVDKEQKGYVEGDNAARFMLSFGLPPEDLSQIWTLADLDKNNRLTKDGFAIALHLMKQRLAGKEIPETLPLSLMPPTLHPGSPSTTSISPSLLAKNKPPPPPPPKRDRSMSAKGLNGIVTSPALIPPSPPEKPRHHYTPMLSPMPSKNHLRSRSSSSISSPDASTSTRHTVTLSEPITSPFEDSNPSFSFSQETSSGQHTPVLSPSPRPADTVSVEVLEGFKKETARLTLQVEGLLSQLTAQNKLRDANEALRNENDRMQAELQDMERTVNEVLSASEMNGTHDLQAVDRLTAELANKDVQYENMERMLAVVTQNEEEIRKTLRESQQATTKAKAEVEELKRTVTAQNEEIAELKSRLTDMGNAMSEPASTTNNRELRVLIRDVTKENDSLKSQVRDMQKSMEQLLLSTKFHAKYDEVERENKRLKQTVQELELIAAQMQSSSSSGSSSRGSGNGGGGGSSSGGRGLESLTRENDQLKVQLRDGQRTLGELRAANEAKLVEMQQQIDSLTHENNRLKIDVSQASNRRRQTSREENVPPPAYDDSFVIPP